MEKTSVPPFDETPAPNTSLHPNESKKSFHETLQPLGVHFRTFLDDFILDHIPETRQETLDENSAHVRGLILEAEKAKVAFELSGVELLLQYRISGEGEEWTVSI